MPIKTTSTAQQSERTDQPKGNGDIQFCFDPTRYVPPRPNGPISRKAMETRQ